ncbi:hypothetical protein [Actinotignum schaalii]|uniref:Uncharacterized protein n=1 Tax=Actinotignum schaalii FB123-CNA-2 TaxID=883067 RepID=S2VK07_9ACTO|nr:hypothetical protein [Actinotignum schaalii]EPD27778.1 hypothetical protein HMPREF9237_00336 [Actinotignum schaalii FB123-CNA-2]
MGVIRGVTEEDILAFLREHGIEAGANYLVVRKYRSFLGGIGKLLVSNLWNAIDAAVIRVLVVTDAEFIVINPEGKSGLSNISRADGERFQRYPWESVIDFHVERKATTALISWTAEGKAQTWEADINHPGVFSFNPVNLPAFLKHSR